MKLVEEVTDDVTIVEAYGRLDSTTAQEFGDRLIALIKAGRGSIVVDLKNIAYISSAGFRALLIADRFALRREHPEPTAARSETISDSWEAIPCAA